MKAVIFDASTLITLTMNGLEYVLGDLKKDSDVKFIVTKEIVHEAIEHPLKVRRFALGALKVKALLDQGILELPEAVGVKDNEIKREQEIIRKKTNNMLRARGKFVELIHGGEASCLALGKILNKKNIMNVLAIDERTTRVLYEKPESLKKLMGKRLHTNVEIVRIPDFFKGFKFIRSTEIVFYAYKKGLIKLKGPKVLEALLYGLRFKGCSITDSEIKEMKTL